MLSCRRRSRRQHRRQAGDAARAQFDVSALYYQKSLYENADNKTSSAKYGYDLVRRTPGRKSPTRPILRQPAQFLRHAVRRQGRGDQWPLLRDGCRRRRRVSRQGRQAGLQLEAGIRRSTGSSTSTRPRPCRRNDHYLWTISAKASLPAPSPSTRLAGLGRLLQTDPKSSKSRGQCRVKVAPKGSSGKRTGWSGFHVSR